MPRKEKYKKANGRANCKPEKVLLVIAFAFAFALGSHTFLV